MKAWPWHKRPPMITDQRGREEGPPEIGKSDEVFRYVYRDLACYITSKKRPYCELSESESVSLKES